MVPFTNVVTPCVDCQVSVVGEMSNILHFPALSNEATKQLVLLKMFVQRKITLLRYHRMLAACSIIYTTLNSPDFP